ncbi:MAG: hypothetical protein PWP07_736 [Epulopiscium sp.]|nr:hypothetical protein [Candidatus Epulonipiscium sp.]
MNLSNEETPEGAVALFSIKQADGTIISRTVKRGAAYALTVDQALEATVQVQNGLPDQTAEVIFMYCDQNLIKAKEGNCCPPPLVCDDFSESLYIGEAQLFLTWESLFPVKGTLLFNFIASFDPTDNPSATIKVERFKKPTVVRNVPLKVSDSDNSDIPFVLAVDDIRKVTVTASEIAPFISRLIFNLCHQEKSAATCCDEPLKCENSLPYYQPAVPSQNIKIWESFIPVKGTFSIANEYDGTLTLNIDFFNEKTFERILGPGEGFAITAKEVKAITIRLTPLSTQFGYFYFQYCIQDIPLQKTCKASCCPKPLHCYFDFQSYNHPMDEILPLCISKIPVDGEIQFWIEGLPQQRTKVIIKRFGKPDIVKTIQGSKIFAVRTTDLEGVFVQLSNGTPENSISIVLCIQDQVPLNHVCCPEPVKCEFYSTYFFIPDLEYPLNKNIALWESTEPVKGTFSIFNDSQDGVEMTVKMSYKNGCFSTRTLKSEEGFIITDEGIISVSVRFTSENPEANRDLIFESCTQNILDPCKKDHCCPQPLLCQDIITETYDIRRNQNYLLWHTEFPAEAIMLFYLFDGESATIIIERYNKSTITETILMDKPITLAIDHIKNVFVKVNSESMTGSVAMELCMQEELPLKGDENQWPCKY